MSWIGSLLGPFKEEERQKVGIAVYQNFQQAVNRVFFRFATARPASSSGEATQYVLTDADADAVALVNALEDCLFHGLKKSGDGAPHCWHFLESLSRENNLAFGPTILAIGMCRNVRTDRGLCRAWIRKALNQNCLHYCFETLFSKSTLKLRSKYYDAHAIVRDDGSAAAMCGVLKAFDTFPCDFGVDDPQLDVIRGLDPEDALVYSKKCKSELEALEVEVNVTSCGLASAVGQYAVAAPGLGKIAVSRRLERPTSGDGGGRELARYRHTSSLFSLVCCTPAIVLPDALCNLAEPSASLHSIILWTLVDERDKVQYFVESSVKMLADGVYPVWALLPPQAGWQQALDDAGVPFAALPVPILTTITGKEIVLGPLEAPKTVEVAVPSRGTSPVPPPDVNWSIAKAVSQESSSACDPPVLGGDREPARGVCISPLTAALSTPADGLPPPLSLLDTRSQVSRHSRRSRASSKSNDKGTVTTATGTVLSNTTPKYAAVASQASGSTPISSILNSSGSSAWSAKRLDAVRQQVANTSSSTVTRKPATAVKKTVVAVIQSDELVAPFPSPKKSGVARVKRRLNKSASAALDVQRLNVLDCDVSPEKKSIALAGGITSPSGQPESSFVFADDSLVADNSISSLNSEDMSVVTNLMSLMTDAPSEPLVTMGTVLEDRVSPIPSVASASPPLSSQPTHGSPGSIALPAPLPPKESFPPVDEVISMPTVLPVNGQPSPAGDSPSGRQLSIILEEPPMVPPVAVTLPPSSPLNVFRHSVPSTTASPTIHDVIARGSRSSPKFGSQVVVLARPVDEAAPFSTVDAFTTEMQQDTAHGGVNTSLTDSVIEEMKDDGPAPLDVVTSAFASERKRLMDKLERSQSRSRARLEQTAAGDHRRNGGASPRRSQSRINPNRSVAVVPDASRSRSVGMQRVTSSNDPRAVSRSRIPRVLGYDVSNAASTVRSGVSSRSRSRARARIDVLEEVGPDWKATKGQLGPRDPAESSDDSLGGENDSSSRNGPTPVQTADVFYAPVLSRSEQSAQRSVSRSQSRAQSRGQMRSQSRPHSRPRMPEMASPRRRLLSPRLQSSPDDAIVRVSVAEPSLFSHHHRAHDATSVGEAKLDDFAEGEDHKSTITAFGPVAVLTEFLIENYCSMHYPSDKRPGNHGKISVALSPSVVSPPPSHTSPPQPASGSTATSSTSTQVIPRIVNQLDVGEALLYHKLELCDVVAKVSSFHVSKSKGAEYVEYAIEVHMLADAYARMCVHNNVPVARHGDVYCYTRYYRYSKFAKFHERLQAANPNVTLPPFPSASLFQFLDTSFLSSRLKKLQTYMEGLMGMRRVRYKEAPIINGEASVDLSSSLELASFLRCVPRDMLGKASFEEEYYSDLFDAFKLCYASSSSRTGMSGPAVSPTDSVPSNFTSTSADRGPTVNTSLLAGAMEHPVQGRSVSVLSRSQYSGDAPIRSESARRVGRPGPVTITTRIPQPSRGMFRPKDADSFAWSPHSGVPFDTSSVGSHGSDLKAAFVAVGAADKSFLSQTEKSYDSNDHVPMDSGEDSGKDVLSMSNSVAVVLRRLVLSGIKYDRSLAEKVQKKDAMKKQNGLCAECKCPLSRGLLSAGYAACEYSGTLCCKNCHSGDRRMIPARVVWMWDLDPAPVCNRVAEMLDLHFNEPIVCLSAINPELFDTVKDLQKLRMLRTKLCRMRPYLTCCPSQSRHIRALGEKAYYMETAEMWSFADISDIPSGALLSNLMDLVATFADHIKKECETCYKRGLSCRLCKQPTPMFEFDMEHVTVCPEYRHFFHKHCFASRGDCPSCIDGFISASGRDVSGSDTRSHRSTSRNKMRSSFPAVSGKSGPASSASDPRQRLSSYEAKPPESPQPRRVLHRKPSVSFSDDAGSQPLPATVARNVKIASPPSREQTIKAQAVTAILQQSDSSGMHAGTPPSRTPDESLMKTPSPRMSSFFSNEETVKRHTKPVTLK